MHAEKSKPIYTLSLGTMVTPEMSEAVKYAAAEAGMRPAEWLRTVVELALMMPKDSRVVLAELMAFREITLNLLFDLSERLKDDLETMVMKVDSKKMALADRVIEETKGCQ